MTKPPVLILGARSDIGKAVAHRFASLGHPIQLAARNAADLEADKVDMELRHAVSVALHDFDAQDSGTLVGISSVAGERGCATNYVYGAAKAGFTAFLSGLRNRLSKRGVHVVTVLPGFVATQMTEDMDLPAKLTAEPGEVADAIVRAVERKTDVIYVRPVWRVIMMVIRCIPERMFKRMKI
ncbi:SDR family NAD(P)-dependent oxidoreductase [Aquicoccus sp. SU-CL01552]|uniref:SDR family NAD(P)-dependent oxidoreductase n=1 Tax=Aquicoccus sp. SU-CL01552 TaxID=3127656 RepID=UPI00310B8666